MLLRDWWKPIRAEAYTCVFVGGKLEEMANSGSNREGAAREREGGGGRKGLSSTLQMVKGSLSAHCKRPTSSSVFLVSMSTI